MLRRLLAGQERLSRAIERRLPAIYRQDGHRHYTEVVVPPYLRPGITIYDVGGGKRPYLTGAAKAALGARVVGLDIDAQELASAPAGSYDRTITVDLASYTGDGDADLVICQAVLEHVRNVDGSLAAIATILKPGGEALIFVPCRNALYARLNLLLPESFKRKILFAIYPHTEEAQGFPSHYQSCTPSSLARVARRHGLEIADERTYWTSTYFYAFVPAYLLRRGWLMLARTLGWKNMCETFVLVLRKPNPIATGRERGQ